MIKNRFFSYSWHIDESEENVTSIRIYGLDSNNKNVCVRVDNFTPYVYIELPTYISWTQSKAQLLGNKLDEIPGQQRALKKCLIYKKKLYGANMEKDLSKKKEFPYLFCSFSNSDDIKNLSYKIKRTLNIVGLGALKLKLHENNASPILQLVCCRDLPTAGWIEFVGTSIDDKDEKLTLCDYEYKVKWKNLKPYNSDILAKPKIMGFDIEVNSSNPAKMPNAEKPGDKVFQISCVISRQGDKENEYKPYLLTLGNPEQNIVGKDVIIRTFTTESDLLDGFTKLIREENPNIIVGYNILGVDIPYMIARAKHNMCIFDYDKQGFHKFAHAKEHTIRWSSSAYKNQEFQFLDAEGRLYVDLLPLVRRDYKMDNYKLKTISTFFLGETKDPLSVKGIFKCYRIGTNKTNGEYSVKARKAMGIVGKYCVQDSVLVVKLMEHLQSWPGLCEMAKTCNVSIFTLYTQGQQIKVFSQVYKFCMNNNMVVERDGYVGKDDDRYAGAYVFDPIPGVYDVVLPFDFASLYPTTIIAYNIDYSTFVTDPDIPDSKCHIMEWEDHVGCCHDPKIVRKMALTKIIDQENNKIKKLRETISNTLDKLRKKELMDKIKIIKEEIKPYVKERSEINKKKPKFPMCNKRYYRFLKEPLGVFPTLLQNLLNSRANTRKQIKENKNKIKLLEEEKPTDYIKQINYLISLNCVLDKRQLSYKISANSMYGAMGCRKGYLPFMPGAMCVTYMGRVNIEKVAETIPKKYGGELIYGDTDSNYIHFPNLKTASEAWDYAEHVAKNVTKLFPKPICLEFEEIIYWRFLILTKKRYMYTSCQRDGEINHKVGKKGVLLARRDNSGFIRNIYEEVINKIFNKEDKDSVLYFIIKEINKLFSNFFPVKDFIVTKSVGNIGNLLPQPFINEKGEKKMKIGDYTVPILPIDPDEKQKKLNLKNAINAKEYYLRCLPAQVKLAEKIRKRGQRCETGTRLEYVITTNKGSKAKQYEKIESADYFIQHKSVLRLDFLYYLKLLTNPLDQVLLTSFKIKDFTLNQYKIRLQYKKVLDEIIIIFTPKIEFIC